MRIAFFGGSFDPPHLGHLRIARAAAARLALDQVLLAPVGSQPLKSHEPAPFRDRLRMVEQMVAPYPELAASQIDAPRALPNEGPNYTVDTLARLRATVPGGAELLMLAGADSFLTLPRWREPGQLLRPAEAGGLLAGWILAARPGFSLGSLRKALPPGWSLSDLAETSGRGTGPVRTQSILDSHGAPGTPLHLLPDLDDPATATQIREQLRTGGASPVLVPEVARYIREHGLYRMLG